MITIAMSLYSICSTWQLTTAIYNNTSTSLPSYLSAVDGRVVGGGFDCTSNCISSIPTYKQSYWCSSWVAAETRAVHFHCMCDDLQVNGVRKEYWKPLLSRECDISLCMHDFLDNRRDCLHDRLWINHAIFLEQMVDNSIHWKFKSISWGYENRKYTSKEGGMLICSQSPCFEQSLAHLLHLAIPEESGGSDHRVFR